MSNKFSYASVTSKNVATTIDAAPVAQSAINLSSTNKSNQKQQSNITTQSPNNYKSDFPVLSEKTPAAEFFPPETSIKKEIKESPDALSSSINNVSLNQTNDDLRDENQQQEDDFKEKKRRSDRSNKNSESKDSSYRNRDNKSRIGDGFRRSAGTSSSGPNRASQNNRLNSSGGEKKSFAELLEDETKRLQQRYKDPKDKLCFGFVKGDLFSVDSNVSLAHCVSEDFRMAKGIATEFKKRFNNVNELLDQNVKTGGSAFIKHKDRYVFYLVTKKYYNHKPYYHCVENSLKAMLKQCQDLGVNKLAMPMIATGLDKLDWDLVSRIIDDVFNKSNINLTIYKFESNNKHNSKSSNNNNNSKNNSINNQDDLE